MALPMRAAEQKTCSRMCHLLWSMACGNASSHATQVVCLDGTQMGRLGRLGRRGKLGLQQIDQPILHQVSARCNSYPFKYESATTGQERQGKQRKGKGKKGGKTSVLQTQSGQMDQPSPFQKEDGFVPWSQMDSAQFMPSTTLPSSPFASLTASSSTDKKEWIEHIKRAYPDPNTMPEDTKIFLEKTEQETGRTGIKSLHQATKYLGKVKKRLGDVTDQRRAHRNLWMNHLAKGIQLWEKQLADFRKHQALLTDQAGKARTEISAASRIIQQLSSATAGGLAPPTPLPPETEDLTDDPTDKEEEVLRKQLQGVLQNCASSLGLDFEPSRVIEIKEEDEKVEEDKRTKRQRSQEPSGVATKQQ